jgi:chemotaxis protein CheD
MELPSKHRAAALTSIQPGESHDTAVSHQHFLHAGQVFASAEPQSILLILGSCVAVCIWDQLNGIGGATHYLLPTWDGRGTASPRYGNVAISALLQRLLEEGANPRHLRAKIFGGGCLFDSMRTPASNKEHLGARNVEIAQEILAKEHIPIESTEVNARTGIRILFQTGTGAATVSAL